MEAKPEVRRESLQIRERVRRNWLTYKWLINELGNRGVQVNKSEMSKILAGTMTGSKAETVLYSSIRVLDEYEASRKGRRRAR